MSESKNVSVDPFSLESEDKSSGGCFQTWADEINVSKYPPLKIDKGGRKCYPSPKEKKSFLQRMEERDRKQTRMRFSPKSVRNLFPNKSRLKIVKKDAIEELHVSPKMKKFIRKEFEREKLKYSFLPEPQVKLQVVHRFKVHIRSAEMNMPKPKKIFIQKSKRKPTKSGKSQRSKARLASGDSGYNEESDTDGDTNENKSMPFNINCLKESDGDDENIEEYDDANLPIFPSRGAFEICPKKNSVSAKKPVLVCFHTDSDTDSIVDSSQETKELDTFTEFLEKKEKQKNIEQGTPIKFHKDLTKEGALSPSPNKRRPKLPYLLSSSPTVGNTGLSLECEVDAEERKIDVTDNDSEMKTQFLGLEVCFDCLTRREEDLLVCSACEKAAYCNQDCQLANWNFHRKFCRKIKSDMEMTPQEMEEILLKHLKNAAKQARNPVDTKLCKSTKRREKRTNDDAVKRNARKSVKFLSQPEYECDEHGAVGKTRFKKTPVKSILKQKNGSETGNLQAEDPESNTNDSNYDGEGLAENWEQGNNSAYKSNVVEEVGNSMKTEVENMDEDSMENKEPEEGEVTVIPETDSEGENSQHYSLIQDTDIQTKKQRKEDFENTDVPTDEMPKSTPDNSPQIETRMKSVGALGPNSSGRHSMSRSKTEVPSSTCKAVNLGDEHEELEINFSQNEEDANQMEIYLPIPTKLSFEDLDGDCEEPSGSLMEKLDEADHIFTQFKMREIHLKPEEQDQSINISDIDLGSSFEEYFNGNEEMFKMEGQTTTTLEPSLTALHDIPTQEKMYIEKADDTDNNKSKESRDTSPGDDKSKESKDMSPGQLSVFENSATTSETDVIFGSTEPSSGYLVDMFNQPPGVDSLPEESALDGGGQKEDTEDSAAYLP